jgi:PAS domain S-box-containing protein
MYGDAREPIPSRPAVRDIVDDTILAVPETNRLLSNCRLAARLLGLLSVGVGLAVLLGGWAFGIASLRTVLPGYTPMRPNTALGLLLCGAALWLDARQARGAERLLAQVCAGMAGLIGVVTLIESILEKNLGIDEVMFRHAVMLVAPGRMATMAAVSFVLLGCAMLLSGRRRSFAVGQYLVITAGVLCLFNAIGYLYGIRSFYGLAFSAGSAAMAIHTSLTFLILCAGVLLSRPDWGLVSTVNIQAPGGVMARRLLPAALLIPVATGWLRWHGQLMGLYDTAFGLALFTACNIVIFAFLIWRCGQILNRLDIERARAEGNMRQLADCMPQIVWTATPAGESDYFNQGCYDYIGMTFEQTRDGGWVSMIHPDEVQDVIALRASAFASREPYTVEYRFRRASDGMYRWHLGRAVPVFNPEGELVRWTGTCTDIHSIKLAEAALRNSESQFRQIADSLPQIVWTAAPDGNLDYYNRRWYDYTGMNFEQTRNWGWEQVLHPDDLPNCVDRWTRAFTNCEPYEVEYRFRRAADSVYRWHLGRARPIRDAQGAVVRWFGTCTDIEDYKQAEAKIGSLNEGLEERVRERTAELDRTNQQLGKANGEIEELFRQSKEVSRLKSEFLANMSHEIRTPMNGVIGMTQLALDTVLDDEQREYISTVRDSADSLLVVINDILDFSKIEAGKMELAHEPFNLRKCVSGAMQVFSWKAREKKLELTHEVSHDVPEILTGDAHRLRQIMLNLVANAMKFTEAGNIALTVSLAAGSPAFGQASQHTLCFSVRDTGCGIPPDKQSLIFEAFAQADGSATRRHSGTGLGLAICCKLVQLMDGRIWVESTPGSGSTFSFTAAFLAGQAALPDLEAAFPTTAGSTEPAQSLHILLAEDNIVNRRLAELAIKKMGHRLMVVDDGAKAVRAAAEQPFDLILMDLQMPEMSGLEATAAIRDAERQAALAGGIPRHIPIMAMTAHAMSGDREICLQAGMDDYISKPIQLHVLHELINRVRPRPGFLPGSLTLTVTSR